MSAGRSLPGWAVGLSIFGSYVSSISFLANPGASFEKNWNAFVFALSMPLAIWVAARYFVPFYRRSGEVSAYNHLEHRFGPWARTYAVVCYLLTQVARLGTILYLLALALEPLTGVEIRTIIVVMGVLVTIYPFLGGTEAVIWTGVVQAIVLLAGALVCIVWPMVIIPGGPEQVFEVAAQHDKFSLGSFGGSLAQSTFWVVLAYGIATNLQNLGIDQSYVQRYITAESDGAARRSVWMGGTMFIPMSAGFFFIGTSLFALYTLQPDLLPERLRSFESPKEIFPYFIGHQLPAGVSGLVVAAICAAAMDSNLNCSATLFLCDIYRRYMRPAAGERESMWVLRLTTLVGGALSTVAALAMINVKSVLDVWWTLAGAFGGAILGLFLLGILSRRVTNGAALFATIIGTLVIAWISIPTLLPAVVPDVPDPYWILRCPLHERLNLVVGTLVVIVLGFLPSTIGLMFGKSADVRTPARVP